MSLQGVNREVIPQRYSNPSRCVRLTSEVKFIIHAFCIP
jgi:hypothetical protein